MAAAYRSVDGGHLSDSRELSLLAHVDRYGYSAIYDRPLRYREIRAFNLAESVKEAYMDRSHCGKSWAEWAEHNQDKHHLLNAALLAAERSNGES